MSRRHGSTEIEHPAAYYNAVRNSIYARATAKRRREWDAANPDLAAWLNSAGPVPTFARKSYDEWGSLSPKATDLLRKILTERTEKDEARKAQWAAEKASATPWTAGRQVVEGVVVSVKWVDGFSRGYGPYSKPPQVKKVIIKRADGSRVYASAGTGTLSAAEKGDTVRVTLTIEPKAEEPTFAFGSRPAKGEILIEAQREEAK